MQGVRQNRVREHREARGWSQSVLAAAVQLSRQSIYAIEAGRTSPAVDVALKLSRVLGCAVEELFADALIEARFNAEVVGDVAPGRVALAHIAGRWLCYSLAGGGMMRSADGLASSVSKRGQHMAVETLRPSAEARENIVLMGCAPALGLLADRLNARPAQGRFLWLTRSSTSALEGLAHRQTHLAGVHLVDAKTGEANLPDVRRLGSKRALVVITLARWEAGLLTAAGNPKRISCVAQLAGKGLRLASREPGSGARRLLDQELREAGLAITIARRASVHATSHVEVAHAVALGAVDAGIATRDAALSFGLGFVPLAEERYDVVVARDELSDPRLVRLFDAMTAAPFRRELAALGYDVSQCGTRVAEILAA